MGVEGQDADAVEAKRVDPRAGDRIVAADQDGEGAVALCRHSIADRAEGIGGSHGLQRHVAGVMDAGRQGGFGFHVVGREPREDGAEGLWAQVAAAGRQGPLVQAGTDLGDGGQGMVAEEVGDAGPGQGFGRHDGVLGPRATRRRAGRKHSLKPMMRTMRLHRRIE